MDIKTYSTKVVKIDRSELDGIKCSNKGTRWEGTAGAEDALDVLSETKGLLEWSEHSEKGEVFGIRESAVMKAVSETDDASETMEKRKPDPEKSNPKPNESKSLQYIKEAARLLRSGDLVAFPTETVYGLGADGLCADASEKIYAAKERPSDNPLILHIAQRNDLYPLVEEVPKEALLLAKRFWPGPLTMILKKSDIVPLTTTGGLSSVAIRMPDDSIARALIKESGTAIAAPSANRSGRPSPTKASHVWEDMHGKIPMILDGGAVGIGLESTIIDLTVSPPAVLRPGAITAAMLREVVGEVISEESKTLEKEEAPKAPGMKYRHYAPKAKMIVVQGESAVKTIIELASKDLQTGLSVGIIATGENRMQYQTVLPKTGVLIKIIGEQANEESIARNLFATLREFDESDVNIIYSESFEGEGMRTAIMNRLLKAAGQNIMYV